MVAISEFRDGSVPASYGNLRQMQEALAVPPEGMIKVYSRG